MAKVQKAKTASRNSPDQRGDAVVSFYNGRQVVKVAFYDRNGGKTIRSSIMAWKDLSVGGKPDMFVKDSSGNYVPWSAIDAK